MGSSHDQSWKRRLWARGWSNKAALMWLRIWVSWCLNSCSLSGYQLRPTKYILVNIVYIIYLFSLPCLIIWIKFTAITRPETQYLNTRLVLNLRWIPEFARFVDLPFWYLDFWDQIFMRICFNLAMFLLVKILAMQKE